jgi:site-specific recombinase XerC
MRQSTCCAACAKWRRAFPGQAACLRCDRVSHVSRDGLCRPCLLIIRSEDPGWILRPLPGRPLQLAFLLPGARLPRASSLILPANRKDKQAPAGITTARRAIQPEVPRPAQPVSPHLVDPAQGVLFDARRDWSFLNTGQLDQLPALTPAASAIVDELGRHARACGWTSGSRNNATKTLRILLAWIGAGAPVPEADIRALSARPSTTIRRVLQFLRERGMVIPDPARQGTAVERTIQQRITALPEGIAGELRQWVKVVRGEGRRAHRELPFSSVRSYLNCLYPVLAGWSQHITSLREITRDDIQAALGQHPGVTAHNLLPALRSLFRALKQERIIFRDPTSGITLPFMRRLPVPIPTDLLCGLIDRAGTPMARAAVALIAIHGLGKKETTLLQLDDLDLPRGQLAVRRPTGTHTVYLDELSRTLMTGWLRERHHCWPLTGNTHVLVTSQTAADPAGQPIALTVIDAIFAGLGLTPSKVRQDRILDEARHTADPVHLMRVFGLTAKPAMRYVQAAHPERRSTVPR